MPVDFLDIAKSLSLRPQGERPQTDADLADLVARWFGVRFPDRAVCPGHVSPWETFCDAYFARHSTIIVKASRLFGGKSYWAATLGLVQAIALGIDVDVLGGSGDQSRRVVDYMRRHWNHPGAPLGALASEPGKLESRLTDGNVIRALMASQRSVRGSHPTRLILDEIDEMPIEIFDAAQGLTYSQKGVKGATVMVSTHHHADGTFQEVLRRAAEKDWRVVEWCYKETLEPHGWLAESEVYRKQSEMSRAQWEAEVELQEPEPEGRAIATDKVDAMFDAALGEYQGRDGETVVVEGPQRRGQYVTGVDWAQQQDYTTITTYRTDRRPMPVVAFERVRRRPWPELIEKVNQRTKAYGDRGCHDATGMNVAGDYLRSNLLGVPMVGKTRQDMLSVYVRAIEHGEIVSPMIRSAYTEHRYARTVDLFMPRQGHLPDTVASGALAYWAVSYAQQFGSDRFMSAAWS